MTPQEPCCMCPPEAGSATCERNTDSTPPGVCPVNGQPGKVVPGQTVKALLAVSLRTLSTTEYRFCPDPACPVVYFSRDGRHIVTTTELRERVYQKEPTAPEVWVCYCFRHRVGDIRTADATTQHAILADITQGIQAGHCACDLRNPQGSCCLGNVRTLMRQQRGA